MSKAIAGTVYFKIDGNQYSLRGNIDIDPAVKMREPIVGADGYHGHKTTPQAPFFTIELSDLPELSIRSFEEMTDVTCTIQLESGKTYLLRNACCEKAPNLNPTEGSLSLKFFGPEFEEILA